MDAVFTSETHRVSCFSYDEQGRRQKALIDDYPPRVQIFEVQPGTYVFFHEDEKQSTVARVLYPWMREKHLHPTFEVREKHALDDVPPVATFVCGDLFGHSVEDVELQLQGPTR